MASLNELLIAIVTLCVLIYSSFIIIFKHWEKRGFPYLKPKLPVGKNNKLLRLSKNVGTESIEFYEEIKKRGLKFAGVFSGLRPVLIVIDPEYIKDILVKDFSYFVDRGFIYNEKADPITAHLFSFNHTQWKPMRVKLTPTFTSGKMKMMFHSVVAHSENLVSAIDKCVEEHGDFDSKEFLANFTTDVIGSCAFGIEMNSFDKNRGQFRACGKRIFEIISWKLKINFTIMASIPSLAKALGLRSIEKDVAEYFTKLVTRTVKYREENQINHPDFLQLLIDMKNKENSLTMNQILYMQLLMDHAFCFSNLEKYLASTLQPIVEKADTYIKNSEHFTRILNSISIEPEDIMAEFFEGMTYRQHTNRTRP